MRIFFGGGETERNFDLLVRGGVKHVCLSVDQLSLRGKGEASRIFEKIRAEKMTSFVVPSMSPLEGYTHDLWSSYKLFLNEWSDFIALGLDLSLFDAVGGSQGVESLSLKTPCVPLFSGLFCEIFSRVPDLLSELGYTEPLTDYEKKAQKKYGLSPFLNWLLSCYCATSRFIALDKTFTNDAYREIMTRARSKGVQVCMLSSVSPNLLLSVRPQVAVSSSFLVGQKYGSLYECVNGKLWARRGTKSLPVRRKYEAFCLRNGVDLDKFLDFDPTETSFFNLLMWKEFEKAWSHGDDDLSLVFDDNISGASDENGASDAVTANSAYESEGGYFVGKRKAPKKREEKIELTAILECDLCTIRDVCQYFKPGFECIFEDDLDVSDPDFLLNVERVVIKAHAARLQRGFLFEQKAGGTLDPQLSRDALHLLRSIELLKGGEFKRSEKALRGDDGDGDEAAKRGGEEMFDFFRALLKEEIKDGRAKAEKKGEEKKAAKKDLDTPQDLPDDANGGLEQHDTKPSE